MDFFVQNRRLVLRTILIFGGTFLIIFNMTWGLVVLGSGIALALWPCHKQVASPDGTNTVNEYTISTWLPMFGFWVLLLIVMNHIPRLGDIQILNQLSVIIFLVLLGCPILNVFLPIWWLHFVVIRRNGRVKYWYFRLSNLDTIESDYLWIDSGNSLLIANSDEHWWYLYRCDFDHPNGGAFFPCSFVIGHRPPKRMVTFKDDWPWLEELWQSCGFDPEHFDREVPLDFGKYQRFCYEFFSRPMPRWAGFPLLEYHYGQQAEQAHSPHTLDRYRDAMNLIPEQSTAFKNIRSDIESKFTTHLR